MLETAVRRNRRLPKGWPSPVRSSVVHALSLDERLARYLTTDHLVYGAGVDSRRDRQHRRPDRKFVLILDELKRRGLKPSR